MTSKETLSLSRQPLEDRVSSTATELSAECLKSLQRRPSDGSSTEGGLGHNSDGSRKYVPSVEEGPLESFQIDSKRKPLMSRSSSMQNSLELADTRKEIDLQVRPAVSPVHWGTRLRNLAGHRPRFPHGRRLSTTKLSGINSTPIAENASRFSIDSSVDGRNSSSLLESDSSLPDKLGSLHPLKKGLRRLGNASVTPLRSACNRTPGEMSVKLRREERDPEEGDVRSLPSFIAGSSNYTPSLSDSASRRCTPRFDKATISGPVLIHSSLDIGP
jgi:hypothetical protein